MKKPTLHLGKLKIVRVEIPLSSLPDALEGFKICHLSDFHRSPSVPESFIQQSVKTAMTLEADMIVLTGDYVSPSAGYITSCARALSSLKAKYGVYGVLGNHDYWTDKIDFITEELTNAGIEILINHSVPINTNGTRWWLAGVDDVWSGKPSLEDTLKNVPEDEFRILLCHEPDYADEAAKFGIPIQLSGHSHCGQFRFFKRVLILPRYGRKYPVGLQKVGNSSTLVYTNAGIGAYMPPFRWDCDPEITLITLRKSS